MNTKEMILKDNVKSDTIRLTSLLGISDNWHFHILFNHGKFSEQELQNAIFHTNIREKLPSYCLELKHIDDNTFQTQAYCIKEMKVYFNNKFGSDRIIFSNCLFGI